MTWRRLEVLIRHLPSDSALARDLHGEAAWWTPLTYLMAEVVDCERGALWQRGGGKGPQPRPIRRPRTPDPKHDARVREWKRREDHRRRERGD